jgi:hypothetical protein
MNVRIADRSIDGELVRQPSLLERRLCAWCQRLLPTRMRRQARTCSKACRQSLSRANARRKRRPELDLSLAPAVLRTIRGRAVAALAMLDTAAASRRVSIRAGFVIDAARELRQLVHELDDAQRRAFEEREGGAP